MAKIHRTLQQEIPRKVTMKTVDQKRVKKIIRDLIEDKEVIGFEMVELPDGSEKSFTFFYTDKEVE